MKSIPALITMLLVAAGLLTSCQSPNASLPAKSGAALSIRNNGYSLLHQLLSEQKDVSLLRFIKTEHADVKELMKQIATTSGTAASLLEAFARDDPSLSLDDLGLPPAELATRAAIAATKKKELLGQSGAPFELTLLLTETEALNYAWHLAAVTGENESHPVRARALAGISEDMKNLYQEVFALLLSKTVSPATNSIRTPLAATSTNSTPDNRILMIDPSSMPLGGGNAILIVGPLQRANGVYSGAYRVKVFPYFFENEKGTLAIVVSDESLAGIRQGKVTAIAGTATTSGNDGQCRHIDVMVTPVDLNHGTLKLWFMAGNRKMIFEPAYHVDEAGAAAILAQTTHPTDNKP